MERRAGKMRFGRPMPAASLELTDLDQAAAVTRSGRRQRPADHTLRLEDADHDRDSPALRPDEGDQPGRRRVERIAVDEWHARKVVPIRQCGQGRQGNPSRGRLGVHGQAGDPARAIGHDEKFGRQPALDDVCKQELGSEEWIRLGSSIRKSGPRGDVGRIKRSRIEA